VIDEYHTFSDAELAEIFGHDAAEPEPIRPFDIGECMLKYARSMPKEVKKDYHRWDEARWSEDWLEVEGILSKREAHFWFWAGTCLERLEDTASERKTTRMLRRVRYNGNVSREEAVERLAAWHDLNESYYRSNRFYTQGYLARVLRVLFPIGEAVEILYEAIPNRWVVAFSQYFGPLPQDPEQIAKLRALVDQYVAGCNLGEVTNRNMVSRLAPMAKHEAECRRYLEWEISRSKPPTTHAWAVLGAFEDDDVFLDYLDRLQAPMGRKWVVAQISRFGLDACERIYKRVSRSKERGALADLPVVLGNIHSTRVVPAFLHMYLDPDASLEAEEWLMEEGEHATLGLMQHTTHRGRFREPAIELLRRMAEIDERRDMIEELMGELDDSTARAVKEAVLEHQDIDLAELEREELPEWLARIASTRKPKGMPRFISLKTLKPIYTAGLEHQLPRPAVWGLLDAFKDMTIEEYDQDVIDGIEEDLEFESVREFIWSIFLDWTRHDTPNKYEWCLEVLGILGDDTIAMRLKPFFDDWPAQKKHDIAYRALEILEHIGSDTALMMLSQLARGSKFKEVKTRAQRRLEWMAAHRKVNKAELEDRIIDDCGVDPDGTRVFDYGPRQFTLRFDEELEPVVESSEDGKITKGLPRVRKSDDQDMVDRAKEDWRLMKKQLAEVVKTQTTRLEQAMITGRRWNRGQFEKTMVEHPLMRHIAQRVIWAAFDEDDKVQGTFRITEELGFAGYDDDEFDISECDEFGVVHPLEIPEKSREHWSKTIVDYEIHPPFEQMNRKTYKPEKKAATSLEFKDTELPPGWFRGHMNRRQWVKARPEESGMIRSYTKTFDVARVTAEMGLNPGIHAGDYKKDKAQKIAHLVFREMNVGKPIKFKEVDPIVYSEVLWDIHQIVDRVDEE